MPAEKYEQDWARKRLRELDALLDDLDAPKVSGDPDEMDLGQIVLERVRLWAIEDVER